MLSPDKTEGEGAGCFSLLDECRTTIYHRLTLHVQAGANRNAAGWMKSLSGLTGDHQRADVRLS